MFEPLQNWLLGFTAGPGGYVGLFLSGALATTLVPLSPEAIAVGVWKAGMPVIPVIAVLAVSNYLGNALNYWLGYLGRDWVMGKYFPAHEHRFTQAQELFERYGPPALLFSWLPFIGDPMTFIPGIVHYSFAKFTIYVLISKVALYSGAVVSCRPVRYIILAFAQKALVIAREGIPDRSNPNVALEHVIAKTYFGALLGLPRRSRVRSLLAMTKNDSREPPNIKNHSF